MKLPLQAVAAANEAPCDDNCHERPSDTYSPASPENVSTFCGAAGDGDDGEEARSLPHPSDTPAAINPTASRHACLDRCLFSRFIAHLWAGAASG